MHISNKSAAIDPVFGLPPECPAGGTNEHASADKVIAADSAGPATPAHSSSFERDLVALMPNLCSFSYSLCRNRALADDMAQQALMKAWRAQNSFRAGTNLRAWLFTILRNEFYSHTRRAWRETHWDADAGEKIPSVANEQGWTVELSDMSRALDVLPRSQREALLLVAAGGLSFQEAAENRHTPIGTMKSRVTRARRGLSKILDGGKPLQPRISRCETSASDEIMGQLSVLAPAIPSRADGAPRGTAH